MFKKIVLTGLAMLIVGCALPMTVTQTPGGTDDLSGFSTYSWRLPPFENPQQASDRIVQMDSSMRRAVAKQMSALGFHESNVKPDLIFDYAFNLSAEYFSEDKDASLSDYGWVWRRDDSGNVSRERNQPDAAPSARVDKAELELTTFDTDVTKILWQVKADKLVENQVSLQELDKNIHKAVAAMFKNFPKGTK